MSSWLRDAQDQRPSFLSGFWTSLCRKWSSFCTESVLSPREERREEAETGVVVLMGGGVCGRKRKLRASSLISSSIKWGRGERGPNSLLLLRDLGRGLEGEFLDQLLREGSR